MKWINIKEELPTDKNNNGDSYNCVLVYSSLNKSMAFAQYIDNEWELLSDGIFSDVGIIGINKKNITHWTSLCIPKSNNQPERSKREDLNCNNCKGLPAIFNCCWNAPGVSKSHKNDKNCDDYNFRMRCSEHCGNTVRDK